MTKQLILGIFAILFGIYSIYDWYKDRESTPYKGPNSYRGPIRLPMGIIMILIGFWLIIDFFLITRI